MLRTSQKALGIVALASAAVLLLAALLVIAAGCSRAPAEDAKGTSAATGLAVTVYRSPT